MGFAKTGLFIMTCDCESDIYLWDLKGNYVTMLDYVWPIESVDYLVMLFDSLCIISFSLQSELYIWILKFIFIFSGNTIAHINPKVGSNNYATISNCVRLIAVCGKWNLDHYLNIIEF